MSLSDKKKTSCRFFCKRAEKQAAGEAGAVAASASEPKKNSWDGMLRTMMLALLLAFTFRSFAFEPFHIPSSSMEDTLLIGDYVFVTKYSYGYSRFSFPYGLPFFHGRMFRSEPERGDVVVFRPPNNTRIDFIKRLIGLPGDKIQVIDGQLYVNGELARREPVANYTVTLEDGSVESVRRYRETLPGGVEHSVLDRGMTAPDLTGFTPDNTGVYTVPPGHYFMMGDNRDNSTDSRYLDQVGFIPEENLIGRADIIMFSFDGFAPRWSRFFTPLG